MADLDSLSIVLRASAKDATDAIDSIIHSLTQLNGALNNFRADSPYMRGLNNLASGLKAIRISLNGLDAKNIVEVSKALDKMASSSSKLAQLTGIKVDDKAASKMTEVVAASDKAYKMAEKMGDKLNFDSAADGVARLAEGIEQLQAAIGNDDEVREAMQNIDALLEKYSRYKNEKQEFYKAQRDIINSNTAKLGYGAQEALGGDYESARRNRARAGLKNTAKTGTDIAAIADENTILGIDKTGNEIDQLATYLDRATEAAEGAKKEFVGFHEADVTLSGGLEALRAETDDIARSMGIAADQMREAHSVMDDDFMSQDTTGANLFDDPVESIQQLRDSAQEAAPAIEALNNAEQHLSENAEPMAQVGNIFQGITTALESLQNITLSDSLANLTYLKDAVSKFGNDSGSKAAGNIQALGAALSNFHFDMPRNWSDLVALSQVFNRFGQKSQSKANYNLLAIRNALERFQGIHIDPTITTSIQQLGDGLYRFGLAKMDKAVQNIPQLAGGMTQLITSLANAPQVSESTIRLVSALGNMNVNGGQLNSTLGNVGGSLKRYTGHAFNARKASMSLAAAFGKMYANFFIFFRLARRFKSDIDLASDLTEVQNVVDVTFANMADKMNDFSKSAIEALGMSELTAKQVGSKYQAMGKAMGISSDMVKSTNDFVQTATNGYADVADSMADISINLTRLAGDMASFYNMDYTEVAEKLQAVFTGQTRPMRAFGIDLTQASLKAFALANGLNADIKSMTQAEKTLLRYQYVMAQTTAAHGDFQRTADTWANSVRVATEKLNQLRIILGKIAIYTFKPLVQNFNKAMDQILKGAEGLLNALGKIFGWQVEWSDAGVLQDESDDAGDLADNMGDAADNAKKFKNFLLGIDELNLLPDNSDKDKGSGSGVGDFGGLGDYTGGFNIKPVEKGFDSIYDTLYKLGKRINEVIKELLQGIDWDKVYKKARAFGKGLAEFVNGLLSDSETFYEIGKFLAGGVNTLANVIDAYHKEFDGFKWGVDIGNIVNGFTENLDWNVIKSAARELAHDLAQTINGAFVTIKWDLVGSTIANGLNTAIEYFYTLGSEIKWGLIGTSIADGINGFFRNFEFAKLAQTLSIWAKGLLDALIAAIKRVDWKQVGISIGEFLGNIDFISIIGKVSQAFWEALDGIFTAYKGAFDTAPFETAIGTLLTTVLTSKTLGRNILKAFRTQGKKIAGDLSKLFKGDLLNTFMTGFLGGKNLVNITSAGNVFTDLKNGINAVSSELSLATKAVGGLAAGLGEFFAIKNSVYDLVRGTDEVGKSIAGIVGAASLAGIALTTLLGFPTGLIATLAVGAVAGLTGVIKGFMDNQLDAFNQGVINALTVPEGANLYDYMGDLTESVRFAADGFNSLSKKADSITDMKDKIGADMDEIDLSIQKMDLSLKAQIDLLPDDIATVVSLFNGLNDDLRSVLSESYDLIVAGLGGWSDDMVDAFEASKPEILSAIHSVNEEVVKELDDLDAAIADLQSQFDAGDITDSQFYESLLPLIDRQNEIKASLGLVEDSVSSFADTVNGVDLSTLFEVNGDGILELSTSFVAADEALRVAFDSTITTIDNGGQGVIDALNVYKENAKDLDTKATIQKAITIQESDMEASKNETLSSILSFYGDVQKQLLEGYDGVVEAAKKEYSDNIFWYHMLGLDEGDVVSDALKEYEEKQIQPFATQLREKWGDVFDDDAIFVDKYAESIRKSLFASDNGLSEGGSLVNNYKAILEKQLSELPDVAAEYAKKTGDALKENIDVNNKVTDSMKKLDQQRKVYTEHANSLDALGNSAKTSANGFGTTFNAMGDVLSRSTLLKNNIVDMNKVFEETSKSGEGVKTITDNMTGLRSMLGNIGTVLAPVKTGFNEFTEQTKTNMMNLSLIFGQTFNNIMKYGNQTISWLKGSFVPYFSGAYWNSITASIPNAFGNAFRQAINIMQNLWGKFATWANDNMKMNVKANGKKEADIQVEVPKYSTGGFPEDGFFWANHSEMVGHFSNGKTAVANNEQIVEGIRQGVYEAVSSAMQNMVINNTVELNGDASTFFTAMVKENNKAISRMGTSPMRR